MYGKKGTYLPRPDDQRFWVLVDKTPSCWLWRGCVSVKGYGSVNRGDKVIAAHRWSWILAHGSIPDGMQVLHSCDVRNCVRPDHLFIGTNDDNVADRERKGRNVNHVGIKHGNAKLDDDKVLKIRRLCEIGIHQRDIAVLFFVSQHTVSSIHRRETWRHV